MTSPLPLPDWAPAWVHLAILLVIVFFGLMLLLMPFSVFGTKSRLETIEARLDEIQGEIRSLALRLPEPVIQEEEDDDPRPRRRPASLRPPIPPAPLSRPVPSRSQPPNPGRSEPRLY